MSACPLTMKHVAKRSGDSCGSERRSHPRAKTTLTELWRGRDPEAEAGSRTTAGRSGNSCRSQSSQALEPRSHPHSGPQQGADQRGWRREATEERPPMLSAWRGNKWCWSVQQNTQHNANQSSRALERHPLHAQRVEGGQDGAGDSRTTQNTWVCTWTGEGLFDVAQDLDETKASHYTGGVGPVQFSGLGEHDQTGRCWRQEARSSVGDRGLSMIRQGSPRSRTP